MYTITIDGKEYHAKPIYSEEVDIDGNIIILRNEPILDESGNFIKSIICICAAWDNLFLADTDY